MSTLSVHRELARRFNKRPNRIYFFCTIKGNIISSKRLERYRTFRELELARTREDPNYQRSDVWLVEKLQEHYQLINRQQQSALWDLLSLKDIGFVNFVRVSVRASTYGVVYRDQILRWVVSNMEMHIVRTHCLQAR